MATATGALFTGTGGCGFIETGDVDDDVFVHMADVGAPDLEEGQKGAFDIEQADKEPRGTLTGSRRRGFASAQIANA